MKSLVILFFVIVLLGISSYLVLPNFLGSKSFTSEQVTFKYPKTWEIRQGESGSYRFYLSKKEVNDEQIQASLNLPRKNDLTANSNIEIIDSRKYSDQFSSGQVTAMLVAPASDSTRSFWVLQWGTPYEEGSGEIFVYTGAEDMAIIADTLKIYR